MLWRLAPVAQRRLFLLRRTAMASLSSSSSGAAAAPAASPLDRLREEMRARGLRGYIVPSEDAHQSEYVRDADKRRAFVSGFDGSAGTAAVTTGSGDAGKAGVWTDGRYYLQAETQMSAQWSLMKTGEKSTPSVAAWLADEVPSLGGSGGVGFDPRLASITTVEAWKKTLDGVRVKLVEDEEGRNLVDVVWGDDKPAEPRTPVRPLGIAFSGETSSRKLSQLRAAMQKKDVQVAVVSALDEVAWLLNLRGADIDYNPLFMSFVVVTSAGDATLCAEPAQLASARLWHISKRLVSVSNRTAVLEMCCRRSRALQECATRRRRRGTTTRAKYVSGWTRPRATGTFSAPCSDWVWCRCAMLHSVYSLPRA